MDAAAVVPFPAVVRAEDLDVVIGGAELSADVLGGYERAVGQGGYDGHVGPDVGAAGDDALVDDGQHEGSLVRSGTDVAGQSTAAGDADSMVAWPMTTEPLMMSVAPSSIAALRRLSVRSSTSPMVCPCDVVLNDPMVGHEYLEAAHDDVDVDAGRRLGNFGFGEVEFDAAHDAGDIAALEVLGAVALMGLAHRDGYVEVAFGTRAGIGGPSLLPFTLLSAFATALAFAVVAGPAGNDGYADEYDADRPDVCPPEDIEQHELDD